MDPHKPSTRLWNVTRGLKKTPRQKFPFRALALSKGITEHAAANAFCQLQQRRPASGLSHEKTTEAAVLPELDEAFTMRELKSALQECSQHTSPGPDGVTYKALANLGPLALGALLQQYNVSWNTGQLPESWKKSRLVPILKAGKSPLSLESYRPIALSSCIGKLMERMILNRLLWYLEKTGVFPECMSGFRRGRSAIDGVVDLVSDVEQHRSRRLSTVAVFLDIKAAFDSVEHSAILTSLIKLRVRGRIYNWILDYLQGRTIYLTTTEGNSDCFSVTAGVPQGGVLSPTLFNVVLAHLPQELSEHVKMSMYADDLCIWSSGPNRAVICGRLQKALSRIERYLNCRGLHPSPSKCVAMAFTRRSCKRFPIHIGEQIIPYVNKHTFLGIVIDRRLTWAPEMNRLRCKVNSYVNIMRCLSGSTWGNSAALMQLHKSMVLGSLRYSLPLLHRVSSTTQRGLLAQQARSLRVVLGVPRASPSAGVIAEAHEQRIEALRVQETLRHYSCFSTQHEAHHLAGLHISRPASSFAEVVRNHVEAFPANAAPYRHPQRAPWTWLTPTVHLSIPDVGKGTAFGFVKRLLTQYYIEENYKNAIQIYTDGSSTAMSSSSAIYVPDASISEGYKLSHRTSSTASELHGILQALHYIEATSPKSYVVCTDSKSALASLSTTAKKCAYPGLQQAILDKNDTLHKKGYAITYQ
ncbi:uncharacterized protein ISCGN_007927 [Ixodes scapularis]